ncbi:MAG: penicillin-binding protein, partial [Actinobacteria bacterium]|nr:penicillin-binding protein [Actinomycetota bacterium]
MASNDNGHSNGNGGSDRVRRYAVDVEGRPPGRRRRGSRGAGKRRWVRWLLVVLALLFLLLVAVIGGVAGTVMAISKDLPRLADLKPKAVVQTSFVYDRNGKLIGELHGAENRVVVSSEKIPQVVKDAAIAIEDERFYEHHGIDVAGLARALWTNIQAGATRQGASTITQQFVRMAYSEISMERTYTRKMREMVVAWQLEDEWTKDEILTGYLNMNYYGNGSYGVEAASRTYFHRPVSKLTLPEAALLAGIVNAPTYFDPIRNPEASRDRRDTVLLSMHRQGLIDQAQLDEALNTELKVFKKPLDRDVDEATYFTDYVTQELVKQLGQNVVFGGGLRIHTSIDMK